MDPTQKAIDSIIQRFVKEARNRGGRIGLLTEALGVKAREVISLVGAGGKTTLMFRLAKELLSGGKKVVTTTTTKILEPTSDETPFLFVDPDERKIEEFVRGHLDQYHHITIARERIGSGKLKGVSLNLLNDLWTFPMIDTMIIEADGAAGRPIKVPREGEPVIPMSTSLVVAILGIDGMEMRLNDENVFQAERVSKMTGIPMGGSLTDEALAVLMTHSEGIFKGAPPLSRVIAFINKVDIPDGIVKAKRVAKRILDKKNRQIERVVLGQLKEEPPVVEMIFA
jgi:probable selenium-dependent hydroxylase accessory protein YqeC